jgi:alcohol dehydrogenase class IV
MDDLTLRKFLIPEFIFGIDAIKLAGQYARNLGANKVMVVTDPVVTAAGWVNEVLISLDHENIPFVIFSNVSPNPRDFQVMIGVEEYKREKCDAIIAVGGGSVMDCAKGIGIVAANKQHILSYEGVDRVPVAIPPLICIPTTGGSSADVSQFAIINNTAERVKIAIISKSVVPDIALVDPVTLTSLDSLLTAYTGIDALVHALEAYVSNASSVFTDMHAIKAIELIGTHLMDSIHHPLNVELRGKIMLGSLHAGLAFSNASLGCVHSMAHSLGGFLDLPHGKCNALLLPHIIEFNYNAAPEKYGMIGQLLGVSNSSSGFREKRKALLDYSFRLLEEAGITNTLQDEGVKKEDISTLAGKAIKDPCNATNPRKPTKNDLEVLFKEAM